MQGNSGDAVGVSKPMTRAHVYEPAFGRLFSALSLTPSRVAGAAISAALLAYLLPRFGFLAGFHSVLLWVGTPACLFFVAPGRFAYGVTALFTLFGAAVYADSIDRSLVAFLGLGGSVAAVMLAHHRVEKDHAFDNFDQFLAVAALAMCWAILGAFLVNVDLAGAQNRSIELGGLIVPIVFGLSIAGVAVVGDLRRLFWLRRLAAGKLAGYAVKTEVEGAISELPALLGGVASDALLVARESMPGLPFRSGSRETPVARVPGDPKRLVRRTGLRLFVAGASAAVQLLLAVGALSSP